MMIERITKAADDTRRGEFEFAISFAIAAFVFGVLAVLSWLIVGTVLTFDWQVIKLGVAIGVVLIGFVVGGLLTTGAARGWIIAGRLLGQICPKPVETPVNTIAPSAPTTLPTLPPVLEDNESFLWNRPNRVGEEVPKKLIYGFDERDLWHLCDLLQGGFKHTEDYFEKYKLPYSKETMGKAVEGDPYYRFMQLCTRGGVILGRKPKAAGTLVKMPVGEMMQRLKSAAKEIELEQAQNAPIPASSV